MAANPNLIPPPPGAPNLNDLPQDMKIEIAKFLTDPRDLFRLLFVSRDLNVASGNAIRLHLRTRNFEAFVAEFERFVAETRFTPEHRKRFKAWEQAMNESFRRAIIPDLTEQRRVELLQRYTTAHSLWHMRAHSLGGYDDPRDLDLAESLDAQPSFHRRPGGANQ